MSTVSHTVLCHPSPVDLGVAYPGQMVSASLLVWRSDGEPINEFVALPLGDHSPAGFALYRHRQDARHCRVDVVWMPAANSENKAGALATAFEMNVDGARQTVPVRLRLLPRPAGQSPAAAVAVAAAATLAENARRPPVSTGITALVASGIVAIGIGAFLAVTASQEIKRSSASQSSALEIAAEEGRRFSAKANRPGPARVASAAAKPSPKPVSPSSAKATTSAAPAQRVAEVNSWRDVRVWRLVPASSATDKSATIVVDMRRRPVRPGDTLQKFKLQTRTLPAAVVFEKVRVMAHRRVVVHGGSERVAPGPLPPKVAAHRDDLRRLATFFRSEAQRADAADGSGNSVAIVETMQRFRQTFHAPFPTDIQIAYGRLGDAVTRGGGEVLSGLLTAHDLRAMASQTDRRIAALTPPPVDRPLTDALVVEEDEENGIRLRRVRDNEQGNFHTLTLTPAIEDNGHRYTRILSTVPLELAPPGSLPRGVVRRDGYRDLKGDDLPEGGNSRGDTVMRLPGATVRAKVVVSGEPASAPEMAPPVVPAAPAPVPVIPATP